MRNDSKRMLRFAITQRVKKSMWSKVSRQFATTVAEFHW